MLCCSSAFSTRQPSNTELTTSSSPKTNHLPRGDFLEEERKGQTEISLKDDVDVAVRGELYKTFLMASMGGDIVELPVGGVIRKKSNPAGRQQEMARCGACIGLFSFERGVGEARQQPLRIGIAPAYAQTIALGMQWPTESFPCDIAACS